MSFEALSNACGLNEVDTSRLVRHAMSNHIFQEQDGKVAHTAASRILAENTMIRDIMGVMCEEVFPGAAHGFSLANSTSLGLYPYLSSHPSRAHRFAGAMRAFAARITVDSLAASIPWSSFATVVDLGGGWGPASIALAQRFPQPRFIVQDLEHVVKEGQVQLPEGLKGRVSFQAHDFFEEQKIEADCYLVRHTLHNFPDRSVKEILRKQVPGMLQIALSESYQ
ncbi:MAG: hypothetical protein Q9190_000152 [Brigantiaea leucoxantha]